jgi:hypothetical protein
LTRRSASSIAQSLARPRRRFVKDQALRRSSSRPSRFSTTSRAGIWSFFLDKLPADPHVWIQRVETVGPLRWGSADH